MDICPLPPSSGPPDDGATNVPASDPIGVTLFTALGPDTVDDQTVRLAAAGSVALANVLSLSADARDFVVAPVASLQLPTTLTLHTSVLASATWRGRCGRPWPPPRHRSSAALKLLAVDEGWEVQVISRTPMRSG